MKHSHNTILVTGGGSGIGLATARLLHAHNNQIILVGRDKAKLQAATAALPGAFYIVCDITQEEEVTQLVAKLKSDFPALNIVINNAGKANAYSLAEGSGAYEKALGEITTNYLATVRLTELLLPLLKEKPEAAIINNTSITAFVPVTILPTYSASKAALRSYTQSLRLLLHKSTAIKVFEVLPPLVDTAFSKGLPGEKLAPEAVATAILDGIQTDTYEIQVGVTSSLYQLFLSSPAAALHHLNGIK